MVEEMQQTAENVEEKAESTPALEPLVESRYRWFAVLTQSSMEKKAKTVLEERIKKQNLTESFGKVIIPTQQIERIDEKGKKKIIEQKMMPGYILLQMDMNDNTYRCVKETPKITGFVGGTHTKLPPPLTNEEVDRLINRATHLAREAALKPKVSFEKGERIRVIDGPFTNFFGEVDEIKSDKAKLRVLISVFGRPTPVEIEFAKVEKVAGQE